MPDREKMVFPSIWGWPHIPLHEMGCPTVAIWPLAEKKCPPQLKWNKYKDFGMAMLIPVSEMLRPSQWDCTIGRYKSNYKSCCMSKPTKGKSKLAT